MTQLASLEASAGAARQNIKNAPVPDELFGPVSGQSAWRDVLELTGRMHGGERLRSELNLRYELLVDALGFELGLNEKEGFDYDKWVRPSEVHGLYAPDRRAKYPDDAMFVRIHQVCESLLEAMHVELRGRRAGHIQGRLPGGAEKPCADGGELRRIARQHVEPARRHEPG